MKINVEVLGWTDICCGCRKKIPPTDNVYMLSNIAGVDGSIHFCTSCIKDISNSQEVNAEEDRKDL